jgi:YggT family protein
VNGFVGTFLQFLLMAVWLLLVGRMIAGVVDPRGRHPLTAFVIGTTEPLLAPIRRLLPSTGGVDFSPLIVILVLSAVVRAVT